MSNSVQPPSRKSAREKLFPIRLFQASLVRSISISEYFMPSVNLPSFSVLDGGELTRHYGFQNAKNNLPALRLTLTTVKRWKKVKSRPHSQSPSVVSQLSFFLLHLSPRICIVRWKPNDAKLIGKLMTRSWSCWTQSTLCGEPQLHCPTHRKAVDWPALASPERRKKTTLANSIKMIYRENWKSSPLEVYPPNAAWLALFYASRLQNVQWSARPH